MRHLSCFLVGPALALACLVAAPDARACGGCVVPPDESTQVTGHRMIFATSKTQTTLYDQIEYSGSPESFAWFLPIAGQVEIGLSSDALFAFLADETQVVIYPPPLDCVSNGRGDIAVATAEGSDSDGVNVPPEEEVNVIAEEVVGPYETVQLEATSPGALVDWLTGHGYAVPADVEPVIAAYQQEGFGFLAMKLVPGEGVRSMRPVRVTTPGASLSLPLRMVAAGTGAITPVTLHVVSEGRYEVAGRSLLKIPPALLVWDWDQSISNYRVLRDDLVDASNGFEWLTESAAPYSKQTLLSRATGVIDQNPGTTGWGDPESQLSELDAATADIETLFSGMDANSTWLTRMYARLTREALAEDLLLGASADQSKVDRFLQAQRATGTPPPCGSALSCSASTSTLRASSPSTPGHFPAALVAGAGLLAALVSVRRRRR